MHKSIKQFVKKGNLEVNKVISVLVCICITVELVPKDIPSIDFESFLNVRIKTFGYFIFTKLILKTVVITITLVFNTKLYKIYSKTRGSIPL